MDNGEIAQKLLLYKVKRSGITISASSARELGNVAKETGVPLDELKKFVRDNLHELIDELYK
jgi:endonuclease III-like uncharacterized protein